jgi:hypothetical protein
MLALLSTTIRRFVAFLSGASFWKWISTFGSLGFVAPAVYMFHYLIFRTPLGGLDVAKLWWPTSVVFMGLDTPNPSLESIVLIYAIAVFGNVAIYAMIGILCWPILFVLRLAFRPHHE